VEVDDTEKNNTLAATAVVEAAALEVVTEVLVVAAVVVDLAVQVAAEVVPAAVTQLSLSRVAVGEVEVVVSLV
jgi:hypothetical protein